MRWHWLSALVICAMPCVVWPHSLLRGSEPPANAVIDQPPLQIRLHFSEAVEKGFARIEVKADEQLLNLSASGFQWDASGKKLVIALPAHPPAHQYDVVWSMLAKDGHPSQGRLRFKVKSP